MAAPFAFLDEAFANVLRRAPAAASRSSVCSLSKLRSCRTLVEVRRDVQGAIRKPPRGPRYAW